MILRCLLASHRRNQPRLLACLLVPPYLPAAALDVLTQFPPLCSLCSFPFCFPFVWVLLRVVLRGLTSLGSQQSFKEIKRPYFARMQGESCHQGFPLLCFAGMLSISQAWAWAPDHHEVIENGEYLCVLEYLMGTVKRALWRS